MVRVKLKKNNVTRTVRRNTKRPFIKTTNNPSQYKTSKTNSTTRKTTATTNVATHTCKAVTCCTLHQKGWLEALARHTFPTATLSQHKMSESPVFCKLAHEDANTTTMRGMPNWNPSYDVDYAKQPTMHSQGPKHGIALALNVPNQKIFNEATHRLAYHGSGQKGVSGIITSQGDVRPGYRQAYAYDKTEEGQLVGTGTYASPFLKEAVDYAKEIYVATCNGGRVFRIVMMCRVRDVRVPVNRPEYWVCGECTAYKALVLGGEDDDDDED